MTNLAELVDECKSLGIVLTPTDDSSITVDGPTGSLTPELIDRIKGHKKDILRFLQPHQEESAITIQPPSQPETGPAAPQCRCGSTDWNETPIHAGRSVRRDCARCRKFFDFPIWHGEGTLHCE